MKIELITKDNKAIGWNIIPENREDSLILGNVRDLQFWGFDNTRIVYNGMESENNLVTKLSYIQHMHSSDYLNNKQ